MGTHYATKAIWALDADGCVLALGELIAVRLCCGSEVSSELSGGGLWDDLC